MHTSPLRPQLYTPETASRIAQFIAREGVLEAVLSAIRHTRPSVEEHSACILRARGDARTIPPLSHPVPSAPSPAEPVTSPATENLVP